MDNFPTWAFGGIVTIFLFIMGGIIAGVRAVTKLNSTIEYLAPGLQTVSASVSDLSVSVNHLITKVAVLESVAVRIPELSEAIARLEKDIAVLSEKY